ncbi:MAG: MGMT family protein [Chitinophagaceae bacterium]|nr:MAG: MGMT family protein [Chitinophagaceae bacterium]
MKTIKKAEKPLREKLSTVSPSGKKEESFFTLVYDVVRQIPRGRVTSYGAIAACLGTRLSARMVGWAMNSAHDPSLKIPAHRVVNRNGMLTGKAHFGDADEMQKRLEKEKIKVKDDKIVDFEKVFWDPSKL